MSDDRAVYDLYLEALSGRLSRHTLLRRAAALGIGGSALAVLMAACGGSNGSSPVSTSSSGGGTASTATTSGSAATATTGGSSQASTRPLTPTFYQWIINTHPVIDDKVNPGYKKDHPLDAKIAPVQGFGIERFVAEAKDKNSTWDIYVGMTPFVEMASLVEAGVIEPWDNYMPKEVADDIVPAMKEEAMYNGKMYSWPFLLDVIIQGWNSSLVEKAGLDPKTPPKTWDEYLANAKKVVDSKAAPFGCTFDAHGWRSLAPITHSISTDVYTQDGLFNFTSDAAVHALEIMKQMMQYANPNVLNPGTSDGGVNDTPDEGAFAAQQVAYYVKYQNAHIRMAATWPDPSKLELGPLPKTADGEGGTVFWNTGSALFTYGQNKKEAADYEKYLTYNMDVWQQSIAGDRQASGQLPVYQSIWDGWKKDRPAWMKDWAFLVFEQLKVSRAIKTHKFGLTQFNIGQPLWEKYLKGEESDPKKALQAAQDAVMAEVKKSA